MRDGTGALNMCCMLPSCGEDLEVCYRKGLVDELPAGKEPAGAPACEMKSDRTEVEDNYGEKSLVSKRNQVIK